MPSRAWTTAWTRFGRVARAQAGVFRRDCPPLDGHAGGAAARGPRPHVARFRIPDLLESYNGVEWTCSEALRRFAELRRYCYRVASIVGLICLRIFGEAEERGREYAENLGMALQLTNILRDVGSDLKRGRLYLPADELARFGVSEEGLRRRERSGAFLKLMQFQTERAAPSSGGGARRARWIARRLLAAEIMARVYSRLLDRIEASGFDVLAREVRLSKLERVWIAASTALAVRSAR